MLRWITFEQAIRDGYLKKGDYINYIPEQEALELNHSEIGSFQSLTLKTEDLGYRFAYLSESKKIVIISDKFTSQTLYLSGEFGLRHGPNILLKVCNVLYSNRYFAAIAYFMTERDLGKLPNKLKCAKNLEKTFTDSIFGPGAVCTNHNSNEKVMALKLRPIVSLEPTLFIGVGDTYYDGSSKERGFRISLIDRPAPYLGNILHP